MPLKIFMCPICDRTIRSMRSEAPNCPVHDLTRMKETITAPTSKMMETTDKNMGKSKVKGLTKILRERSRNYARDYEADDLIQFNRKNGIEKSGFLKSNGRKRGKIDDK